MRRIWPQIIKHNIKAFFGMQGIKRRFGIYLLSTTPQNANGDPSEVTGALVFLREKPFKLAVTNIAHQ